MRVFLDKANNPEMSSPSLNSARRETAPYGHACIGCSRTKCKCISRGPGKSCERCHRLERECLPSAVTRKRLSRRPNGRPNRIEKKLDDLVTLLQAQVASNAPTPESTHLNGGSITAELPTIAQSGSLSSSNLPGEVVVPIPSGIERDQSLSLTTDPTIHAANIPSEPDPDLTQEGRYLSQFQHHYLRWLPVFYIVPETTAAQLQSDRPFLWLNIRLACAKSTFERKQLNKKIREILAKKLLVDLERSLDLLLGLTVYLAWGLKCMEGERFLCAYSSLAMSLVTDLRLDRPNRASHCMETDTYAAFVSPIRNKPPRSSRTNEERRVTLACYAVCSSIASLLKAQPMRWTPHMEEHLRHLQDEPETPGDRVLVAIVKVSRIMDDLLLAVPPAHLASSEDQSRTPPVLYVKSLITKLDDTKQQLPPDILSDKIVQSYLHNAYMMVNSIPVMNSSCLSMKSGLSEFGKTDCIYACVDVIKQGLDNWFSFVAEDVWAMPLAPMLQFGRCTHILYRIYMTEDPAWDRFALRKAIDLIQVLERGAEVMEIVPRTVSLHGDGDDFFARTSRALRNAATLWEKALTGSEVGNNYASGIQVSTEPGIGDFTLGGLMSMDTFDDAWLSEIFTSWDPHQV